MSAELPIIPKNELTLDGLKGKKIAIIGYGNQGKAHAQNLRDSGFTVTVGARHPEEAKNDGFETTVICEAADADLVILALPDELQGEIYSEQIEPNLPSGATLGFIHGLAIHYGIISPPRGIGAILVAPKGPGITVRQRYTEGKGVPALLAVAQENKTDTARQIALAWATGIGSARVGVLDSTFAHETETDLFGEQSIIVGGLTALIKASYETLVAAGYPKSLAYIECCHEVKQVADIIYERGIAEMMAAISNTAEIGAYEAMDILDDEHLRDHLRTILTNIQDGTFAKRLVENKIKCKREELEKHEIEKIGKEIRTLMQRVDD